MLCFHKQHFTELRRELFKRSQVKNDNDYMNNSVKLPKISLSKEEKGDFPNANNFLAILIPAVEECYKRWDPVNTRMNHQTFYTYFSRNMDFAPKVYQSQRQGHEFDLSVLDEIDVPHIQDTVPILAVAIEQCSSIWRETDFRRWPPFLNIVIHYLYTIANKMHHTGMKAANLINDFDMDIIVAGESRTISFSEEEGTPNIRPVLAILIPVAQECYTFLDPTKPSMNERTCMTHFVQSVDCAMQVVQHNHRVGTVDLNTLSTKITIPHIEDTLPLLVTAFEKCRSIWTEAEFDFGSFLGKLMFVMVTIGTKMYPSVKDSSISGFGDIFEDSG